VKWKDNTVKIDNHSQIGRLPKRDNNLESIYCKNGRIRQEIVKNDQWGCKWEDLKRNHFPKQNGYSKIFIIPQSRLNYKNRE
jgi:hypothetical protein